MLSVGLYSLALASVVQLTLIESDPLIASKAKFFGPLALT